jgi:hypothetical protein
VLEVTPLVANGPACWRSSLETKPGVVPMPSQVGKWAVGLALLCVVEMTTRLPAQGVHPPARAANGKTVSPPKPTYIEVRSVPSSSEKQTIPPDRVVNYGLKYQDFDRLMTAVTTVTRAVPIRELSKQISHLGHAVECRVVGTTHDYAAVTELKMERGKFLTDVDVTRLETDPGRTPADADNAAASVRRSPRPCSRKKTRSESR